MELKASCTASTPAAAAAASQRAALNDVTMTSYGHDDTDTADDDDDDDDDCRTTCCAVRLSVCCHDDNKQVLVSVSSPSLHLHYFHNSNVFIRTNDIKSCRHTTFEVYAVDKTRWAGQSPT